MATQVNTTQSVVRVLLQNNPDTAFTTHTKAQALTKAPAVNARTTHSMVRVLESSTSTNPKVYTTQSNVKVLTQTASASPATYTTQTVLRVLEANSVSGGGGGGGEVVIYPELGITTIRNGRASFLSSRRVISTVRNGFQIKTKPQLDAEYDPRFDDPQYYKAGR